MFLHGASNASPRPQRSKSTPSFKSQSVITSDGNRYEPATPQDALTAANLAYERAKQRRFGQNNNARKDEEQDLHRDLNKMPGLAKRQSVRFVGPNAVPSRARSITRREAPNFKANHDPGRCPVNGSSLSYDGESVTALPEEFNEVYVASEPSSYRRLRKTKSMFSPGKTPSAIFGRKTPNSRRIFPRQSLQSSDATSEPIKVPDPRLKRSYSFVRGVTDRLSMANRQYATHDAAIQLARDTYLQEVEQQRLKKQPSLLGLTRRARAPKVFRRSVRTSSTNSYGSAISSQPTSVEVKSPAGLGPMAKSVSQTWKEKLRRVFKRSLTSESIPVQHLVASHAHYGDHIRTTSLSAPPFPPFSEPNATILRRVGSKESSLHSESTIVSKSPRPGSVRSVNSLDDDIGSKSRVTSWTNSTAANTVNMQNTKEPKRLSIIREDGSPYRPSASTSKFGRSGEMYATFQQPVKQMGLGRVDTKRIFSALRKEIDQNHRNMVLDDSNPGTNSDFDRQRKQHVFSIPGRRSSNRPRVRHVNTTPEPPHPNQGLRVSRFETSDTSAEISSSRSLDLETSPDTRSQHQQSLQEIQPGLTPQEIANMNEHSTPGSKRPLREVKSAFFPPSVRIERSNVSPFRRAMFVDGENEDAAILPERLNRRAYAGDRIRNGSVAGSDSVYSRSSDDPATRAGASFVSLAESDCSGRAGMAVIMASPRQEPSPRPYHSRIHSAAKDSGDWKKFLASQVAPLEDRNKARAFLVDGFMAKEKGHKKEGAQLDGDDLMIGTSRTSDIVPKQPLGVIQANSIQRPPLMGEMIIKGNRSLVRGATNSQNENAPIVSVPMTPPPSVHSVNNAPAGVEKSFPNRLRQKASQASLLSQTASSQASATKRPRMSPQRAERLRRLKRSSSASLRKTPSDSENQATNDVTRKVSLEHESLDDGLSILYNYAGKSQKLVDGFLKDRRSHMRISEESTVEPAFL